MGCTTSLEYFANVLGVASCNEYDIDVLPCLLHELAEFLGTDKVSVALSVLKDEILIVFRIQMYTIHGATLRLLHSQSMARDVDHSWSLAYHLLKVHLCCNFALEYDLAARFLQS